MEQITLQITRIGSAMFRLIPYEVWFDGKKLGTTMKISTFTIEKKRSVLKLRELGSKFAFHSIQNEVVIFPEYMKNNANVECVVKTKTVWLGVLSCGLFAPIRRLSMEIKY